MNPILKQISINCKKTIENKLDENKKGYIYPELRKKCRDIYSININLNYKLCEQYLYKCYII